MKNILFSLNPMNMREREYWSARSIATRMISSVVLFGVAALADRKVQEMQFSNNIQYYVQSQED